MSKLLTPVLMILKGMPMLQSKILFNFSLTAQSYADLIRSLIVFNGAYC